MFRVAVLIVFVALAVRFVLTVDLGMTASAILHASPALAATIAIAGVLSVVLKGLRWSVFLRAAGFPSVPEAVGAAVVAAGMNTVVVANAGDVSRVVLITRRSGLPSHRVLATLALDKLCDVSTFGVLVLVWALWFPLAQLGLPQNRVPVEVTVVSVIVIALFIAVALSRGGAAWLAHVRNYVRQFGLSVRGLATPVNLVPTVLLSLLSWGVQCVTFDLAARATGVAVPLVATVAALIGVNLVIPLRATPGNVGVFQVFYAVAVEPFGVSRTDALAIAILIQALQIVPIAVVGAVIAPAFIRRTRVG
jgi:uncharacterized protein (TIRG00374 family)